MKLLALATVLAVAAGTTVRADETPMMTTANAMVRAIKKVSPEFPVAAKQLHIAGAQRREQVVTHLQPFRDARREGRILEFGAVHEVV